MAKSHKPNQTKPTASTVTSKPATYVKPSVTGKPANAANQPNQWNSNSNKGGKGGCSDC